MTRVLSPGVTPAHLRQLFKQQLKLIKFFKDLETIINF